MGQSDELRAPFIENEWRKHKTCVTMNGNIALNPMQEFEMRQSFFGGFAKACKILDAEFISEADRSSFVDEVKEEIKHFSAANRKLAKDLGTKHRRVN